MAQSKHDKVAERIAQQQGTKYNSGPGPDVQNSRRVIEVETPNTIGEAGRQLQGFHKPVYVAVTESSAVGKAVQRYQNTMIGIIAPSGKIIKRSSRKR